MLNERERSALNEIENRLDAEDPELAQRLAEGDPRPSRSRFYWIFAAVIGLLLLISIGAQLPVVTLVLCMGMCGLLAHWYLRSRRSRRES